MSDSTIRPDAGQSAGRRWGREADLPLEVVILLLGALTLLITGILLFPVSTGTLPYYEEGLFGLLLVIFAVQTITMGKTPFGDVRRSKWLLASGVALAAVGITASFIPGLLGVVPRLLLAACFGLGGLAMLLRTVLDKDKARQWWRWGGVFRQLVLAVVTVYGVSVLLGVLLVDQRLLTVPATAVAVMIDGAAVAYLAAVLRQIYRSHPEAQDAAGGDTGLSTDNSLLLLMAAFMLLLGVLLIPVSFGTLPFSGSAQLGLLMVIFAIQMLASGNTPLGAFRRTWLMIVTGLVFAALGVVSCIIPGILVWQLTILVGVLNILGGLITIVKTGAPLVKKSAEPREPLPAVYLRLGITQVAMSLLTIMFGTSMLVAGLIPGPILGVVLTLNGLVLVYLLRLLVTIQRQQADTAVREAADHAADGMDQDSGTPSHRS